ncbi:hypothetical protein M0813_15196 [Anaeramoeba flamelloides]|uniref:Uncharacterized protein n=1 Tax=Anaeramoeba flamelloides TaxID=1746091 RepID=A0ABQ8Z3K6_9EUKA|nr:hypothetical protein M0813_15196 [Anaeramoeba flamelloides]
MNTILKKQIEINSVVYLFSIEQSNKETSYSLYDSKAEAFFEGTYQNFPIDVEYANKLAQDLEKNQSFIEVLKERIIIRYEILTINLLKQQIPPTSKPKIESNLLDRLELLEKRVNNTEELELQVQKLNKRVMELEGEIQTHSETFFQNMYSSETAKNVKVFYGSTEKDNSNWTVHTQGTHVKIVVDLTSCNFVTKPTIVTSLGGNKFICSTMGSSSVYYATKSSFFVLVKRSKINPNKVKQLKWHLNWVAIGEVGKN